MGSIYVEPENKDEKCVNVTYKVHDEHYYDIAYLN